MYHIKDLSNVRISILLSKDDGSRLKTLLHDNIEETFKSYCRRLDLKDSNVYRVLNGDTPATLEFIQRLCSGINFEVDLELQIKAFPKDADALELAINQYSKEGEKEEQEFS